MRSVQIYVENRLLDLFDDEQIVVNSSVQNISDIGKVFTDFSQTFTIPCSPNNNFIFEHYYNNDVDNQIDHNRRRTARIEIDHIPFRTGKIQLEKSQIKSNFGDSYTVTFYGDVVTLKDILGEAKLTDLNYQSLDNVLNHAYTGVDVKARVTTPESSIAYDVRYPLITSQRVWQFDSLDANDINSVDGAIVYSELFPAVRVKALFDKIANQFGVTFEGSFLDSKLFKSAFLWYKNKERFDYYTAGVDLEFGESGASTDPLYNGTVQYQYIQPSTLITPPYDVAFNVKHRTTVTITTASSTDYYLDVYDGGEFMVGFAGNGTQTFTILNELNDTGLNRELTFKLRSVASMSFNCTVTYELTYTLVDIGTSSLPVTDTYTDSSDSAMTTQAVVDLSYLAPDMKLTEFITGIFNTFNLTCVGTAPTTFKIQPLEEFYATGNEFNITEWTDFETIDIQRPSLYNNINFKYQQSQSFMNREFFDLFRREYSNLTANFGYDGGDYTIELPFETMLPQRFSDSNVQVQYCLGTEPEYKNYVPKPTLLYMYDYKDTDVSFYFDNDITVAQVTGYHPFGQDANFAEEDYTLNWGSEISPLSLEVVNNTLYRTYYEPYLLNLYDLKTRVVSVKTNLPIRLLTKLKLNDSLIIRDKKYIINDMKSNLVTGEVDLVLLSNWREGIDYSGVFDLNCSAQDLEVAFSVPSETTVTIGTPYESQFATPDDTTPTGEQIVTFTLTANGTNANRTNTFPLTIVRDGVTYTQFITITQRRCRSKRILEGTPVFTQFRTTEDKLKRITE